MYEWTNFCLELGKHASYLLKKRKEKAREIERDDSQKVAFKIA